MTDKVQQDAVIIVRRARSLVLLLSTIFSIVIITVLWNTYESRKYDAIGVYHKSSSQILRGMQNRLLELKYSLGSSTSKLAATGSKQHITPDQIVGIFYFIRMQHEQLKTLDEQFRLPEFETHNERLAQQLSPLLIAADHLTVNPLEPQLAKDVSAVLLVLEQLDRLHLMGHTENEDRISADRLWRSGILLILLFITTLVIAWVVRKTFLSLRRILHRQVLTANNLRAEKELLHITLLSIGDAVITTDAKGLISDLNPVAEQLTGWTLSDLKDTALSNILLLVDSSTREPIESPATKVLTTGETIHTGNIALLISKNGSEHQISYSAAAIHADDRIQGMVLVFNDITEEDRLRESLARSRRNIHAIMENMPNLVCVKDTDGRYQYANNKYAAHYHLKAEDIIGKTDHDLHTAKVADQLRSNEMLVILENRVMELEENVSIGDESFIYRSVKYPLHDENGSIYAVCVISTDITESKQQDEVIRRTQKMDALGKLVGGVAHDYNNMLGVVIGYSDLLADMPENSTRQVKYIKQIRRSAKRGALLTKQLLQFSGRSAGEATALDINQLILDTEGLLGKTLTPKIIIDLQLDKNLWLTWLDSNGLEDALLNLSINAMHAIEANGKLTIRTANKQLGGEIPIQLQQLPAGDYVLISVSDTGCGMTQQVMERMFEPFYSTKGDLGSGLGLSQVYGFVQQSGGAIAVASKLGKGTTVDIYFPRFKEAKESFEEPASEHLLNLRGTETVLLVDDEIALLELAAEAIEQHGYTTFCATNANDAVKILENEKIDLMVSDVVMPEMNGYQLAALVTDKYPLVKIQMVSGYSDNRHVEIENIKLHEARIIKPYSASELMKRMRDLLDA